MKTLNIIEEHELTMLIEALKFFLLNQSFASYADAKPFDQLMLKLQGKASNESNPK